MFVYVRMLFLACSITLYLVILRAIYFEFTVVILIDSLQWLNFLHELLRVLQY